jgi:hypothetical protein
VPSESTFDYLRETKSYVARYGRPIAFYSDKFSVFRVNRKDAAGGDGPRERGGPRQDFRSAPAIVLRLPIQFEFVRDGTPWALRGSHP